MADIVLEVENLKKYFPTKKGMLHAVDDVSFSIEKSPYNPLFKLCSQVSFLAIWNINMILFFLSFAFYG